MIKFLILILLSSEPDEYGRHFLVYSFKSVPAHWEHKQPTFEGFVEFINRKFKKRQ